MLRGVRNDREEDETDEGLGHMTLFCYLFNGSDH